MRRFGRRVGHSESLGFSFGVALTILHCISVPSEREAL